LCSKPLVCIMPVGHELARFDTLTLADLRPYPLISYEKETPFGVIVENMYRDAGEPLNPPILVGSPQNAGALVVMGAGIALVDEFSVRGLAESRQLVVRQVENAPILQANLVHTRFDPMSQLTLAFITQLELVVKQEGFAMAEQDGLPALAA